MRTKLIVAGLLLLAFAGALAYRSVALESGAPSAGDRRLIMVDASRMRGAV